MIHRKSNMTVFFLFSSSILGNLIKLLHIHTSFSEKQCLNYSKKKRGGDIILIFQKTIQASRNREFLKFFKSIMCFVAKANKNYKDHGPRFSLLTTHFKYRLSRQLFIQILPLPLIIFGQNPVKSH